MKGDRASAEARGVGTNVLTLLAQAAMPAFHVQLARVLGVAGYGEYMWANTVVDFLSLVTLCGMDQYVAREVAAAHARGDDAASARTVASGLRVVTASGLVVSALVVALAPALAAREGHQSAAAPLRALSLVPVFFHAATLLLTATQARLEMRWDFLVRGLLQPLALLALSTLALRLSPTPGAAALAVAAAMALSSAAALWGYGHELPARETLRLAVREPVNWSAVRAALPYVATNLVWATSGRLDLLVLERAQGKAVMGAYAACALYVVSISQTRGAFVPVLSARLPAALRDDDRAAVREVLARQTRWCAMAVAPLAALFAGLGEPLLRVFGRGFTEGAPAMAVLTVGHLVSALSLSAYAIPMGRKPWLGTLCALLSVGLQAAALPWLVARWGMVGAALGASAGLTVAQLGQSILAWWLFGAHGLSRGLAKVLLAALGALVVARASHAGLAALPLVARFVAAVALAALTYAGALATLGLEAEDRALAAGALARLRRR